MRARFLTGGKKLQTRKEGWLEWSLVLDRYQYGLDISMTHEIHLCVCVYTHVYIHTRTCRHTQIDTEIELGLCA